ncbi:MAG: glycosyltransferase family 61 protein [Endomicrobium sp.]|jgi:hypothetical protein|nr:glycosyltransferase family 61 protein [Endomicrobium sp.]
MNKIYGSQEFKQAIEKYSSQIKEDDGELKIETHLNAVVLPFRNISNSSALNKLNEGGVFDLNGNIIALSKEEVKKEMVYIGSPPYYNVDQKLKYIDEDVIFLGNLSSHFGHFIFQSLTRLWIYLNSEFSGTKAVYIAESDNIFLDVLDIFGIDTNNVIRISRPTKFKSVTIPQQSHIYYEPQYHKNFARVFQRIRNNSDGYPYEKIYFSRRKFNKGGYIYGED